MAEIKKGILGGVQGKVGTVVGVNWRGKNIIRSLPKKSGKPATEGQLKQRAKFKLVAEFLSPLNQLTGKYFGEYQGAKSRTNLAMSYQLLETVIEKDGDLAIDYAKVVITKGVLPVPIVSDVKIENAKLTVNWKSDVGIGLAKEKDDMVFVVYNQDANQFYVIENQANRKAGTISANIPAEWAKNNSVWLIIVDEAKKYSSTSAFLSVV
ncbi:hypothetical protein HX045_13755 [Myroides odoratimimus]|uniref:Uncharacterized protein n=2 Tax=Myroides odoratimimus TaxID=76832 RepID=A0ABP2NDM4_9FLAO|nr:MULTISPECIES: DUF6266 family protein [Myroides]AJA68689.1 hypothetical protein MYRA21_1534 [Myroides sp. A21]APA91998.1 hypothetical protein BK054_07140 [Myroides sp. ZB35]EHO11156.1 hypothetical protein HMPREF9712_00813 [Myroides odoratimimus CCUG 10230]EHO14587.1 hypothetical protein HMPREF9715_00472 [Myroides odoratimimus CIP 101113]EKB04086.1 hypothetical protein HMPREF9711_02041 [Myroides odoratimimus CCUG 3837]